MRWWTGATVSLASVVRMVQVSSVSPGASSAREPVSARPSRTVQLSHSPAKAKPPPLLHPEEPGLLGFALACPRPLVEAVGRDQAAARAEGGTERRLFVRGLGARVDQLVADVGFLGPRGDQPPAQHGEAAAAVAQAHRGDGLPRRHVVARPHVLGRADKAQQLVQLAPREALRESPAHDRGCVRVMPERPTRRSSPGRS